MSTQVVERVDHRISVHLGRPLRIQITEGDKVVLLRLHALYESIFAACD